MRLSRVFGDFALAEDAVASAVVEALVAWRRDGAPPNPAGWLALAARRNALDAVRRRSRTTPLPEHWSPVVEDAPDQASLGAGTDDRLALLFACCHPALAIEARIALTLRAVTGLTTAQVARAFLVNEATLAQRIVRAKRKIGAAGVPIRIPEGAERSTRLDIVLTVISVMYAQAHLADGGGAAADRDIAEDALWLARVVSTTLPGEAEAHGLLALLLFHRAREDARAVDGEIVLLADQDRGRWDAGMLAEARRELDRAASLRRPGRWQLHAAIAACHADAASAAQTDWPQVLVLYDMLLGYDRSPIVRLNRAVALAEVAGPQAARAEVESLEPALSQYHLWHAVRAHLLRRMGRTDEATAADLRALELTANAAERRLIAARLARVS